MGDLIELRGLRVLAYCGVLPEEQARRQPFSFDLDLECDLAAAGRSDDLVDTVDYGAVCERIEHLVTGRSFKLIERLAGAVADELGDLLPGGSALTLVVTKERPPIPAVEGGASVTLRRTIAP